MRHTSFVLVTISLLGLTTLTGCDGEASQNTAQRHLDAALQTINQSQLGYVPAGDDITLAAYRLQTLEQTLDDLQQVLAQGSQEQQVVARRLLADIHAATARATLAEAGKEYATLAQRSNSLLTFLDAFERAEGLTNRFDRDNAMLLDQLNEEIREQRASREQLVARQQTLQAQIDQLNEQAREISRQVDDAQAQARDLRDQAFVADGDTRYELEEEAARIALAGEKQAAEVERLNAEASLTQADLELVNEQVETIDNVVDDLRSQVQTIQEQGQHTTDQRDTAAADRAEALAALMDEHDQLIEAYRSAVLPRFEQAQEYARLAMDHAREAANRATGADRTPSQVESLARHVEYTRTLVTQISSIGNLGQVLETVASRIEQIQSDQARPLQNTLAELVEQQEQLIDQATQALAAARQLADDMADRGGDAGEAAERHRSQLDDLEQRLRSADLG